MKDRKILMVIVLVIVMSTIVIYKFKKYNTFNEKDVSTILNYYLEKTNLSEVEFERLDVNEDNEVDLFDAILILNKNKESDK